MLAATLEVNSQIPFPVYASPKLDGIRGVVVGGKLLSRSLKPIPNPHVSALFGRREYEGLDGELILGSPTAKDVYRVTNGACARHEGKPDAVFYAFDMHDKPCNFTDRLEELKHWFVDRPGRVLVLSQTLITTAEELDVYEAKQLAAGYEGVILRHPDGLYKFGRSTIKEFGMVKVKRFTDGEFLLLDIEEEMENTNEKKTNELGRGARSSEKAGLVPKGRAGTLVVKDIKSGVDFRVGTGLNDDDKDWFWKHKKQLIGKFVGKYKSFLVGVKDLPRHPVYLGGREKWDM